MNRVHAVLDQTPNMMLFDGVDVVCAHDVLSVVVSSSLAMKVLLPDRSVDDVRSAFDGPRSVPLSAQG